MDDDMQGIDPKSFGGWLTLAVHKWKGDHLHEYGREPSDADFARRAGIPTTSLSVWKSNTRKPTGENINKLANVLGLEVYDHLGVNRALPKDFEPLALVFDKLSKSSRKRLLEAARNILDEEKNSGTRNAARE